MTAPSQDGAPDVDPERVVVRDKRRLDPESGEVRPTEDPPAGTVSDAEHQAAPDTAPDAEPHVEPDPVAALTDQLQRTAAEYANYRKRVDRDRITVIEMATAGFLENLLPLLDNVELARQHGDLEGAFKGVGEGLEQLADKHGLERFGTVGDAFDPAIHHALIQAPEDPEATGPTVAQVLQPGWRLRTGRVVRPAGVGVAEPAVVVQEPEEP